MTLLVTNEHVKNKNEEINMSGTIFILMNILITKATVLCIDLSMNY
jgi:hypothetical protein